MSAATERQSDKNGEALRTLIREAESFANLAMSRGQDLREDAPRAVRNAIAAAKQALESSPPSAERRSIDGGMVKAALIWGMHRGVVERGDYERIAISGAFDLNTVAEHLNGKLSTPPSARKESSMNTCPTCGADLHGRPDWALREAEHNLRIFALIEEVEALRKGVSVTHVNGDPIPAVRAALGDKQYFVDCLTRLRATVGPTATEGSNG